ncbi:MAG: MATE family efflux transporter [Lachnospiraceae bacterium]|nr:MATE family efflux transporter [Lachnospiraceae bacterium]
MAQNGEIILNDTEIKEIKNPLESESVGKLMLKYSLPAIATSLVNSIYNIVDQIFVGNSVGELGNAATNVAFPLVMIITTLAMTFGAGSATSFSLFLGRKEENKAKSIVGNGMTLMVLCGIAVSALSLIFLRPLLTAFGGRGQTLEYAVEYTRIVALGIPFAMLGTGASQLIRADGSPRYAMVATLSGAVLNCILDPIFIFGFNMGMSGAAIATIIGQIVSGILILAYFTRFKTFKLKMKYFRLKRVSIAQIFRLGLAAGINQLTVTIVQIVMNNTLGHYGELSQYGRDIPLACVGVISKVSSIFASINFGLSQSVQPIIGFNYGAGNYSRVKDTFKKALTIVTCVSVAAFLCFQIFPRQIISIFGNGNEMYYEFALRYFHIFLFCIFIVGAQILCTQFFPSIGKGGVGTFVSLSRQVIFLLPLVIVFPLIWGIDGVLWAGPIADGASGIMSLLLVRREMKRW